LKRKEFNVHFFITIFLLTTIIFIIGLFLGNKISEMKLADFEVSNERLRLQTLGIDIQNLILEGQKCSIFETVDLEKELSELSEKIDLMENSLGWDNPQVMSAKEYFSLLEIRHWYLLRKSSVECNKEKSFILYFYSNKGECSKCSLEGTILTNIRRHNSNVFVYHFDINIKNPALDSIKEIYNISTTPSLVINDKTFVGFKSMDEIKDILYG